MAFILYLIDGITSSSRAFILLVSAFISSPSLLSLISLDAMVTTASTTFSKSFAVSIDSAPSPTGDISLASILLTNAFLSISGIFIPQIFLTLISMDTSLFEA